ncbi:MAG: elongation factor G [Proteobacteria bacterium]|nr:elongation factor G [Pseudomonadota bacterium]
MVHVPTGHRTAAIVGPYGSGKTTLFEALLAAAGSPRKRGADRGGTEVHIASCTFMDEPWTLLDCPGSVEFAHAAESALAVADLAIVVCDPAPARAPTLAPLLHALQSAGTPFLVFVNRMDQLANPVRETVAALQGMTSRPLVLRQVPIREGEHVVGYVDVVSERAYRYRKGEPSDLISLPAEMLDREKEARAGLVEVLADHDDGLLEKLVEDIAPSSDEIFERLRLDQSEGAVASCLLGAAEPGWGLRRLWKALRHDTPAASETARRHDVAEQGPPLGQVFRSVNTGQGGKLSWTRVWRGPLKDGAMFGAARVGGLWKPGNGDPVKVAEAATGEIVALGRLDGVPTGAVLGDPGGAFLDFPAPPEPVYSLAIETADRKDDVRLSAALRKLTEEDPSLGIEQNAETGETVLSGQGEIHLRSAVERLGAAFGVAVKTHAPQVPFREAIRKPVHQHARLKRQTGGHGQFADVTLDIAPLPRGEGFRFVDKIVGGVVPRNFIPAVGEAAEEAARKGVFGYPVVDLEVTLVDGGFHSVDSSDMAFRTATRMAIQEALPKADPVLLEPISHVTVSIPSDHLAAAQRVLTGRRGQILGYGERESWPGWDDVEALVPQTELQDLIIELRSATMGLATYRHRFDHLAETHARK